MNCACEVIQHPSNKAKFIRWVVYTANVILMVGKNSMYLLCIKLKHLVSIISNIQQTKHNQEHFKILT